MISFLELDKEFLDDMTSQLACASEFAQMSFQWLHNIIEELQLSSNEHISDTDSGFDVSTVLTPSTVNDTNGDMFILSTEHPDSINKINSIENEEQCLSQSTECDSISINMEAIPKIEAPVSNITTPVASTIECEDNPTHSSDEISSSQELSENDTNSLSSRKLSSISNDVAKKLDFGDSSSEAQVSASAENVSRKVSIEVAPQIQHLSMHNMAQSSDQTYTTEDYTTEYTEYNDEYNESSDIDAQIKLTELHPPRRLSAAIPRNSYQSRDSTNKDDIQSQSSARSSIQPINNESAISDVYSVISDEEAPEQILDSNTNKLTAPIMNFVDSNDLRYSIDNSALIEVVKDQKPTIFSLSSHVQDLENSAAKFRKKWMEIVEEKNHSTNPSTLSQDDIDEGEYQISDHSSDSEELASFDIDSIEIHGKTIPKWARPENLNRYLKKQQKIDPDTIFPSFAATCQLTDVFNRSNPRWQIRSDSNAWENDKVTPEEMEIFKRSVGLI